MDNKVQKKGVERLYNVIKMPVPRIITKRLVTLTEAADYLGISVRQLEYLTAAGETKQTRLPNTRKRLYDILDLDEFIEHSKKT